MNIKNAFLYISNKFAKKNLKSKDSFIHKDSKT